METKSAPSDREWDHRMDRGVANEGDDEDGFHFPSRISEEMLAADIRETTINCDDDHEDDEEYEDAKKRESARDSLIESVNEQLESIEELLHVQQSKGVGYKKFNEDKFTEARDRDRDDDDDDFSDVVSTRDAGTTPPPLSPSDHQLNENDTIDLPTIIPRSLSDDNLYYPSFSAGGGRGGGREEWERDLARFDLDFEGSSDEDDDLYRRDSTPPFPLRLHLGDGVDYDGRGNVNELSRYDEPLTSGDQTDDEMTMSTPEDELREDLEALRRTKARYDAFFQEITQSLNDTKSLSFGGSNSYISNSNNEDDDLTSGLSNDTRFSSETRTTSSLNNTLDSGTFDHERRRHKPRGGGGGGSISGGGRYDPSSPNRMRANRIMQTRTGSYDEEKFKDEESSEMARLAADPAKRNSLEMKYKLPGFCPDANVTTGSLPVNASEFYFDGQF